MTGSDALLREPVIQAVGWALLHFIWQGALVGGLAAAALRLLRSSAADVRYVVASIALALMATLPVVTGVQTWRALRVMPALASIEVRSASPAAAVETATSSPAALSAGCAACPAATATSIDVERWLPMLVIVWMAGVAILALRLAAGWVRVHRLRTHGAIPAEAALQAIVRRLARTLHLSRAVTLLQSPAVEVPTVIGWLKPVVLLPVSALAGLSPLQVEAILAHELAHIRRHDYVVNLLQSLLETLLFYHPAVWWLSRRIRIEREHCCDDLAVSLCGDPVIYARALADLEELRGTSVQLSMAANGGVLLDRVRRLLSVPATHAGRGPAWLAAATAMLLMIALIAGPMERRSVAAAKDDAVAVANDDAVAVAKDDAVVPARSSERPSSLGSAIGTAIGAVERRDSSQQPPPPPPAPPPPPPAPPSSRSTSSISIDDSQSEGSGNYTWSHNGDKIGVNYRGSFALNDTDTDIVRMSRGGYLKISDNGWLGGGTVEFTTDQSGNVVRRFKVGSSERPFEPEGREWLAKILPRFVRQSAFGAKERVSRILAKDGADGVLAEISKIDGDYAKKVYFTELIRQAPLDGSTGRRLLEQAGREIDSDYELATTLIAGIDKLLVDDATRKAYFDAARSLGSDYEMRRVYSAALARGAVSPALLTGILDASRSLDSDYEAATLLLQIVSAHPIEGPVRAPFFSALQTISSSYEKGRALQGLLQRSDASAETVTEAIAAAGSVGSDYEIAQVLLAASRSRAITGAARDAYIRVADKLGDYERNRALAALVRSEGR